MHEHELDIIAALAEGSLSGPTMEEARGLVAACDVCREEYAQQQIALAALRSVPAATMTKLERDSLHHELHQVMRPRVTKPRRSWVQRYAPRLAGAAAALALVALAGSFVVQSLGGDDAADTVANEELAATTDAGGADERSDGEGMLQLEQAEAPAAAFDDAESPTTTAAAATEESLADVGAQEPAETEPSRYVLVDFGPLSLADLVELAEDGDLPTIERDKVITDGALACTTGLPSDGEILRGGLAVFDGADAEIVIVQIGADRIGFAFSAATCELLGSTEG